MFGFALAWKWKEGEKNHHLATNSQMHDNMNSTKYSISIESINFKKHISQRSLLKACQQVLNCCELFRDFNICEPRFNHMHMRKIKC